MCIPGDLEPEYLRCQIDGLMYQQKCTLRTKYFIEYRTITVTITYNFFNPRSLLEKIVTQSLERGGGQSDPPSTFDTIYPIDLKFDTYSKLHLYFQLSETTWCLIGFHGNNSQINDVTGGRHLGFSNFQILFKFLLDGKTAFSG